MPACWREQHLTSQPTMASIDKDKQLEYNLAVLKRRDAAITEVLKMAGHVVLYQFNEDSQSWDLKKVEGSLFVVARTTAPRHMFVVLNRLSSQNLVEAVTADFQMELNDQFLLYRNDASEIIGIWFYSPPERAEIAALLQSLAAQELGEDTGEEPDTSAPIEEPDAANAAALSPVDPAAEATPAVPAPPPAAPTSDLASGGEAATASNNVAAFFSMMQGAQPPAGGQPAPPTPTGATDASATTERASEEPSPEQTAGNGSGNGAGLADGDTSLEALKAELRARLGALLDDDAFLETLAREYRSQESHQSPAVGQAPSSSSSSSSGGTGAGRNRRGRTQQTTATRAEASSSEAPADGMPAHLMALLQQQQLGS
mmetsp:Transcript_38846/g.128635  ORF Transcript_38846/g.128635 Transcript_38846/m.128635 type:complete len:372 (+) Transcript_38846:2-1117(+)